MYTITVRERFTAFLRLAPPAESESVEIYHNYLVEVAASGEQVNAQGYLLDIDELNEILIEIIDRWDGSTLNDHAEFEGVNPTLETVARVACELLADELDEPNVDELRVTLWENELDPPPGPSAGYWMALA